MEDEQEHDGAGDPAQAFDALRAEVAALRQAIEAVAERQAPDYSPDLGRITQAVNSVIDGLEAFAAHPAVRMTPDQFGQAMTRIGAAAMATAGQKLDEVARIYQRASAELADTVGTIRGKKEQRNSQWTYGAVGFFAGILLYLLLVVFLPTVVSAWLAAFPMKGGDRWEAGWIMLHAANPADANNAAYGFNLVQAKQGVLDVCQSAVAKVGKDQRCLITVR